MDTEHQISKEHITNNQSVRNTLIGRGIKQKILKAAKDFKNSVDRKLRN